MNSHHKTLKKIPIGLHTQHASSPAMLTGPLSTPQQQRHLANVKMYQFCGGNEDFPLSFQAILYNEDKRPELFAYFVQGVPGQVLDNAHGNVYFGVANGAPCTMHSLA
jgi:hypothetical protein